MASIVAMIGMTHIPFYSRMTSPPREQWPPLVVNMMDHNAHVGGMLKQARPDCLLVVAHDHLNQFFMHNMPAFIIGKMDSYDGTFNHEAHNYGLPRVHLQGDRELAVWLLEEGMRRGVDFAYSSEMKVDHSVVVPLMMLDCLDLPIVPLMSNCIAPPIPTAARFHQVGEVMRAALSAFAVDKRVAVVVSGHLSLEVGGPVPATMQAGAPDPEFDERAAQWIAGARVEEAIAGCDFDKLLESGNLSHGFLNYLLALGLAGDRAPDEVKVIPTLRGALPYFWWEPVA